MTDSGEFDARPVRAFLPGPDLQVDESVWPASVPAVAQLLREGLELPAGLLSFTASLGLAALLHDLAAAGSQAVVATHSPIVAAIPGAHLLELGPWGIRPAAWDDLSLVIAWRQFMRDPRSYFRHLF
jgi:predicted ATPase